METVTEKYYKNVTHRRLDVILDMYRDEKISKSDLERYCRVAQEELDKIGA